MEGSLLEKILSKRKLFLEETTLCMRKYSLRKNSLLKKILFINENSLNKRTLSLKENSFWKKVLSETFFGPPSVSKWLFKFQYSTSDKIVHFLQTFHLKTQPPSLTYLISFLPKQRKRKSSIKRSLKNFVVPHPIPPPKSMMAAKFYIKSNKWVEQQYT